MRLNHVSPIFVEFIPECIESGKLYISEEHEIAIHKCCCGCGEEVVTPLSPVDWQITKSNKGISLSPSIGNWNYRCKSHYFIRNNKVVWAAPMSENKIQLVQERDIRDKQMYIKQRNRTNSKHWLLSITTAIWNAIMSIFKK